MRQSGGWAKKFRVWTQGRSRDAASLSLAHLGMTYAGAVALYGFLGWWLDRRVGTLPLFTLLGVALGAVGGFVWINREVLRAQAREKRDRAESRRGRMPDDR